MQHNSVPLFIGMHPVTHIHTFLSFLFTISPGEKVTEFFLLLIDNAMRARNVAGK